MMLPTPLGQDVPRPGRCLSAKDLAGIRTGYRGSSCPVGLGCSPEQEVHHYLESCSFSNEGILTSCQAARQISTSLLLQYTENHNGQEPHQVRPHRPSPGAGLQLLFAQGAQGIVCSFPFLPPHSQQGESCWCSTSNTGAVSKALPQTGR